MKQALPGFIPDLFPVVTGEFQAKGYELDYVLFVKGLKMRHITHDPYQRLQSNILSIISNSDFVTIPRFHIIALTPSTVFHYGFHRNCLFMDINTCGAPHL